MKKFVNELNVFQLILYKYLKTNVNWDGSNLISILLEIEEGHECIPDKTYEAFMNITAIERVEVIHLFSKYILKTKGDKIAI
ncbi:Uncharacterised protein [Lysinibacillus capsici]|uniref:Uncharacterized protein n=1 Tax=Lysinibacillus capsici TaxID=2115968 RepID=A0A2X0ZYB7_9BACI|nr:hypothetical protein [Lysinibacillus capsici]SPU37938.1 Uncharacterised protein [Lysinibacillus capsici]